MGFAICVWIWRRSGVGRFVMRMGFRAQEILSCLPTPFSSTIATRLGRAKVVLSASQPGPKRKPAGMPFKPSLFWSLFLASTPAVFDPFSKRATRQFHSTRVRSRAHSPSSMPMSKIHEVSSGGWNDLYLIYLVLASPFLGSKQRKHLSQALLASLHSPNSALAKPSANQPTALSLSASTAS